MPDGSPDVLGGGRTSNTWRLRVRMADRPGTLAMLAIRLADLGCNILSLSVLPVRGGVLDEIVVRSAGECTRSQVMAAVQRQDCECVGITGADVRELVDTSAAALSSANQAITNPAASADALKEILAADIVTVVPADEANPGRTESGHRAVFGFGDTGSLVARRLWAPFVRQELARAEALLGLLRSAERNVAGSVVLTCEDGAAVVLRAGTPADADAAIALHHRCSAATLFQRYHSGPRMMPRHELRRLLVPPRGISVVAAGGRQIVGLGQVIFEPGSDSAEIALLVEDSWQRNGLGSGLLRRLAVLASASGCGELVATCLPGSEGIRRAALRAGLSPARAVDANGLLRMTL
ncbi:GCN5 family acetyltransferase [Prauserella marina]|nr:GCN5 family acetyltransferase [Prauserella marina]